MRQMSHRERRGDAESFIHSFPVSPFGFAVACCRETLLQRCLTASPFPPQLTPCMNTWSISFNNFASTRAIDHQVVTDWALRSSQLTIR